jgi:hypothetical protein
MVGVDTDGAECSPVAEIGQRGIGTGEPSKNGDQKSVVRIIGR